jgi:hypothetical protein
MALGDDMAHAIGLDQALLRAQAVPLPDLTAELAMPTLPDELSPPVAGSVSNMPEDERGETIDEVRERLAARGLLRTGPAIQVPKEPRPERDEEQPRLITFSNDVLQEAETDDEWDVEAGRGTTKVRCPGCREVRTWPADVTRFRCDLCDRAYRWAICGGCDDLVLTIERQESWRCKCGAFTRSWWRTPSRQHDAAAIVGRRRHLAVIEERKLVRAGMRKRRWKIVTFAVVGLVLVLGMVVYVRFANPSAALGTRATCSSVERLRSDLASGNISRTEYKDRMRTILNESNGVDPEVAAAVVELDAAGEPGTTTFLVAQTNLGDACERAGD